MRKLLLVLFASVILVACGDVEETRTNEEPAEEVQQETAVEETSEQPEEIEQLDLTEVENTLTELFTDEYDDFAEDELSVYKVEQEDDRLIVWVDMQNDPLPSREETKEIISAIVWYLVEVEGYENTRGLLITEIDDGLLHWATAQHTINGYEIAEHEALDILPDE